MKTSHGGRLFRAIVAFWAAVAIMVTYHLGQAGLVLSLVWS